jgi:hypothetical protein
VPARRSKGERNHQRSEADFDAATDIAALYREFTEALTEVLAENAVGPA